jgi:steroid delta-isomerase-like uncharacterized protein
MSTEENKALVYRYFEELNKGNLDVIDETFTTNFVNDDPANPGVRSIEDYKQWLTDMRAAFPDAHWTIEDLIAERDKVVVRETFHGTHQAVSSGTAPTSKQVTLTSIHIFRIENGKIVENWTEGSELKPQLDILPRMPHGDECKSDGDCPDGFVCRAGFCVQRRHSP